MSEDLGYGWQSELLDLPAYLKRVGYGGDLTPTAATLRALHRAHVTSIPFENLEIMLGRPVEMSLEAVQAKLVGLPRGGYCFEHNRLFAAVLERLGFEVAALAGRVMLGAERLRPPTHALLHVRHPGQPRDEPARLCDVGFGAGPLEPLPFTDGAEAVQDGWGFRLQRGRTATALGPDTAPGSAPTDWEMHQRGADGWLRRHMFAMNEVFRVDFDVLNYYVYANPRSPFAARPFVQRFSPEALHVLDGTTLSVTRPDGASESRELAPEDLPETLARDFGIVLEEDDVPRLIDFVGRPARA
ncbi:arylamine N-acetyltransferase [Actinomadura sp. NAK00032]|uniref:arylamine N-acetyltransferase family protein n=1 Tax=Actinomadura sp. NAK00032 TaxID=2742128 RepID=UPI0015914DE3|nr:arylamine N-acetyltransferase [Actinomadura sp. NAK00032]QKW33032.1 arylamine N-acetyltransferase [Actinomadura sp. NAK00032]